jgi:hypothetical protein
MGGTGKNKEPPNKEPPKKEDRKSKKLPPATTDDDWDDGDIATPKRDRYGDDDQPL